MKLITTDEQLRSHVPNIIASVKGETPLIERLALFPDLAEDWVKTTFTSESTFNTICGYTDANPTKVLTARLVVADALRRAIPSLDIVLTPNGFGGINTSNIALASKPRVDRLVGSMLTHRDDCIAALLPELSGKRRSSSDASLAKNWLNSEQADFFGRTLFRLSKSSSNSPVTPPSGSVTSNSAHRSLTLKPRWPKNVFCRN